MKKLLFLIMMIVAGNAFTAGTQANEDMAIKRALQSRLNSFFFTIVNEGIRDNERNLEKEAYSKLFKKDYIISNSLKREIVKKYAREISRITADETKLKFDVKQIDYLSNGEAEVVYDIKSKSLKSVPDMLEVDDETERRILERAKMTESELEAIMKERGNEPAKRNYYNVAIEERINMYEKEAKKVTDEEVILQDLPALMVKVDGKWESENLEKALKGIKE